MLDFFRKLFRRDPPSPPRRSIVGKRPSSRRQTAESGGDASGARPPADGEIESQGPGKNVLVRGKYHREDTGTHETLKIIDESLSEDDDGGGIDPYNTGQFDRSKNWDKRFRK